ncbi:hypothetical protein [Virgisporangium ochraceum]|uniref:Uncharacterized protein n=1 Tax=Virgisporangium ochraceum TaxID=65505 RepID=A0A8J3ZU84_9ACTN|nr:hypothetical protein [Virgisporangium ochraceum]GIJ67581.1 hypothetical protein Voc01_024980 [Virgisporangium ochraceum]
MGITQPDVRGTAAPRRRVTGVDPRQVVAWLAAAWLIPTATHLLGVDWLLPPLVLALTAGLLRGGRTLLDRLVLATALLLGCCAVAGMLFTAWPFGLDPVPVAGAALTVLGGVSIASGRAPRLPRPTVADALTVATAAAALAYVALPYLRADSTGRLAMLLGADDNARHVSILDTLRRTGGYAWGYAPDEVPELFDALRFYPSGWHLTAGLLDGFVRSSTGTGDMAGVVDHHVWFLLGTYGVFAVALLWAVQWVGGPLLGGWRRLPVLAFLGVQLVYGDLPVLAILGFVSQLLGLTLLVVLVAVLARRTGGVREHVVLVCALVAGIGFAYELLLPSAGLAAVAWGLRRWRTLRPIRAFVVTVCGVAGAAALVPLALGALFGGHGTLIGAPGGVLGVSRGLLLALAALVAAAVVTRAGRRLAVWRSYVWTLAAVLALPAALLGYRAVTGNQAGYYLEKGLHAVFVTLLVGLAAVAVLLPRPRRAPLADLLPAALVAVAVAGLGGVVTDDVPYRPGRTETLNRMWHSGEAARGNRPTAERLRALDAAFPAEPGVATVVLTGDLYTTYTLTLNLSMLQRTSGLTDGVLYRPQGFDLEPASLAESLAQADGVVRIVVAAPDAEELVKRVRQARPGLRFEVVRP